MINYEIIEGNETTSEMIKATLESGVELWIPKDLGNSDYQRYLRWLENPDADIEQSLQIMLEP